jgi:DNA-binding transcriptional ArsR family regulator
MDDAAKLQLIFQTLGEANRLRIIKFIDKKECSVSEIVEATGLSQPLVSHHLRILRENQILETKREGPFVYYQVKDIRLLDALGMFLDIFAFWKGKETSRPLFVCPPWWKRMR